MVFDGVQSGLAATYLPSAVLLAVRTLPFANRQSSLG